MRGTHLHMALKGMGITPIEWISDGDRTQGKSFHLSPFPCPVSIDKASQRSAPAPLDPWSLRIWFLVALGHGLTPSHPSVGFPPPRPHSVRCLLPTL